MFRVVPRRASTILTTGSCKQQLTGRRLGWSWSFASLDVESGGKMQFLTPESVGENQTVILEQNVQPRKAKRYEKTVSNDATGNGFALPPIVKGAVFREWCKAVAADTMRMAINEAEAKMKSKAGVIGRAEGGELGMKLDSGYVSPHFITDQKNQKCELEDPLIIIHEKKIYSTDAVDKLLQLALKKQRPLLIVAEEIGSDALGGLILSKLSSGVKVCAIKAPGFGDNRRASLQNLAAISGGEIISQELGLDNVEADMLGTCKKVIISKGDTVIVEGAGAKKPTKEKSAEEEDIELVKMHSEESELLLKHLLKEEENLERRQSERLNIIFKKFIQQFPVKKRKSTRKANRKS